MSRLVSRLRFASHCSLISLTAAIAAPFGLPTTATAAEAPDDKQAQAASEVTLTEIIVTANKRAQRLSDVGQTVAAISAESIIRQNITSMENVASVVPGLTFAKSQGNTPILTLRGVGFNEPSFNVRPAVTAYMDEVTLPFPMMTSHAVFDLERIEVLKGPQGTLFGQNSTGGAVNFVSARPTTEQTGGASLSYGTFGRVEANGYVSGEIASNLTARLSAQVVRADGWQKSMTRNDTLGDENYQVGRLILAYDAEGPLRLTATLNGWVDKSDPQAPQYIAKNYQLDAYLEKAVLNAPLAAANAKSADWTPGAGRPSSDQKMGLAALRGEYDMSDKVTLTSLTSYAHFRQKAVQDQDGMAAQDFDALKHDGYIKSFSQELRLSNKSDADLRWVAGANYEYDSTKEESLLNDADSGAANAPFIGFKESITTSKAKSSTLAGFANLEYDVLPSLTLKVGGRYTKFKEDFEQCTADTGDGKYNTFYSGFGQLFGGQYVALKIGDCAPLNDKLLPSIVPYTDTLKEDNFAWRVGTDYKIGNGNLIYANISRGYKAGNHAQIPPVSWASLEPLGQESVTNYEVGAKLRLFNGAGRFNASAYYYDYQDKQVKGLAYNAIFGALQQLITVPKSRVFGVEAEFNAQITRDLTVSLSGTYLDTEVITYKGYNIISQIVDFSGKDLPFTPKFSGVADIEYRPEVGSRGAHAYFGATLNGRTKIETAFDGASVDAATLLGAAWAPGSRHPFLLKGYTLVDLRAGYVSPDNRWEFSVYGKNVFDKYYSNNSISVYDGIVQFAGKPATYGARVSYKF